MQPAALTAPALPRESRLISSKCHYLQLPDLTVVTVPRGTSVCQAPSVARVPVQCSQCLVLLSLSSAQSAPSHRIIIHCASLFLHRSNTASEPRATDMCAGHVLELPLPLPAPRWCWCHRGVGDGRRWKSLELKASAARCPSHGHPLRWSESASGTTWNRRKRQNSNLPVLSSRVPVPVSAAWSFSLITSDSSLQSPMTPICLLRQPGHLVASRKLTAVRHPAWG